MSTSLPDILEGGLGLVFVGINPGTCSAQVGHYYAQATNRFWPQLFLSGCIPSPLKPEDDWKLPRFGIGLTDVVKRVTASSSDLTSEELRNGGEILLRKIRFYQPRIVCFNGLTAYYALFDHQRGPGLKSHLLGGSRVFVLPSTSSRNAYYTTKKLLLFFNQLQKLQKNI